MQKYIIERHIPGIEKLSAKEYCEGAGKSNEVLEGMGKGIQWKESYVAADRIFCVYLAENEQQIRDHAERSGFPATHIHKVTGMLDPTTAQA